MDGVLLDTEELYTEATRRVLGPLGERFDFQLKEKIMGRDPLIAARLLLETVGSDLSAEEYFSRRNPIIMQLFTQCRPVPGAPELVAALAQRRIKMAVATSSNREFLAAKASHHPWFEHFHAIVCGSDICVKRHKPAPDIFLEAARALAVAPEHCVVFEDSPAGVQAAKSANIGTVIAVADPRADQSLLAEADMLITKYSQIELDE